MEPKIYHFGWQGGDVPKGQRKHDGVLTLAVRENENKLYIGFYFCSPRDPFCRKIGRTEALRRMGKFPIVVKYLGTRSKIIEEVVRALCFKQFDRLGAYAEQCEIQTAWIPHWAGRWYVSTDLYNRGKSILDIPIGKIPIGELARLKVMIDGR